MVPRSGRDILDSSFMMDWTCIRVNTVGRLDRVNYTLLFMFEFESYTLIIDVQCILRTGPEGIFP